MNNTEDGVPRGSLLYRYGDVCGISSGDGKRTVEWHEAEVARQPAVMFCDSKS